MTKKTLESRLAVLEKKLAEMEQQLQSLAGKKDPESARRMVGHDGRTIQGRPSV